MDLMFLADKAEQEAGKEADRLRELHTASHEEAATFDSRASQRRVWMTKSELALQVIIELEQKFARSAYAARRSAEVHVALNRILYIQSAFKHYMPSQYLFGGANLYATYVRGCVSVSGARHATNVPT